MYCDHLFMPLPPADHIQVHLYGHSINTAPSKQWVLKKYLLSSWMVKRTKAGTERRHLVGTAPKPAFLEQSQVLSWFLAKASQGVRAGC